MLFVTLRFDVYLEIHVEFYLFPLEKAKVERKVSTVHAPWPLIVTIMIVRGKPTAPVKKRANP